MTRPRILLTPEDRTRLACQLKARDGSRCFYCGCHFRPKPMRRKTFDHYVPYRLWPTWDLDNLVLACERCNLRKDDALPLTLAWLLLRHADQIQSAYAPAA